MRTYSVPKHESIQIPIETAATRPMTDPTHRLLAAIVWDDDAAWYFKSLATIAESPAQAEEQFATLLRGLKLSGEDKPVWDLGDAWQEEPGSGMRVANLRLGPVEFAVSKLPLTPSTDRDQYLLANVNRWRKQIQLQPISQQQLSPLATKVETADGHEVVIVDFQGKLDAASMPSRGGGRPAASSPRPAASRGGLAYEAAEHWEKRPAGMMQEALFVAGSDGPQISVARLGGGAGGVLANVNRWRGQVGLPAIEDEKNVQADPIKVAGTDALLFNFQGTNGKSMAVAMVPLDGSVWFFKLMGTSAAVAEEIEPFRTFLGTVRKN